MEFFNRVASFKRYKIYDFTRSLYCNPELKAKADAQFNDGHLKDQLNRLNRFAIQIGCLVGEVDNLVFKSIDIYEQYKLEDFHLYLDQFKDSQDSRIQFYLQVIIPAYNQLNLETFFETKGFIEKKIYGENETNPFAHKTDFLLHLQLALKDFQKDYLSQLFSDYLKDTSSLTILDIGGGLGSVAKAIQSTISDHLIEIYDLAYLQNEYLKSPIPNTSFICGDFFELKDKLFNITKSYDLILFSLILHDWDDPTCVDLLKKAKVHLNEGGKIIVLEKLLSGEVSDPVIVADIDMLLQNEGRERNLEEFKDLAKSVGLKLSKSLGESDQRVLMEFEQC